MRFFFPCAKGKQAIGHAEVLVGQGGGERLPKAFMIRNVSMAWEWMLQKEVVKRDWPQMGWEPSPRPKESVATLTRGGSSANLTTLLAALSHARPFSPRRLDKDVEIWASGEISPGSPAMFLAPVGEIETKVAYFLEHCAAHGPALFLASVGNYPEIEALRRESPVAFREVRFSSELGDLKRLQEPVVVWLGYEREQWLEFVFWMLGERQSKATRGVEGRWNFAFVSLVFVLLLALGSVLGRYWQVKQVQDETDLAMRKEKAARKRSEEMLGRVQRLLKALNQTMHKERKQQDQRLAVLWKQARQMEATLRRRVKRARRVKRVRRPRRRVRRDVRRIRAVRRKVPPVRASVRDGGVVEKVQGLSTRILALQAAVRALESKSKMMGPSMRKVPKEPHPAMKRYLAYCRQRQSREGLQYMLDSRRRWRRMRDPHHTADWSLHRESGKAVFSPNNRYLVTLDDDHIARVWKLKGGKVLYRLKGHRASLTSVAISSDGLYVATASQDKTARVWHMFNGRRIAYMKGHTEALLDVGFIKKNKQLISVSKDGSIRRWEVSSGREVARTMGRWGWAIQAVFSPGGGLVGTTSFSSRVQLWSTRTGRLLRSLRGHKKRVAAVAFSSGGRFLATASLDDTVRLWDVRSGKQLVRFPKLRSGTLRSVTFSADGSYLVSAAGSAVDIWDVCSGKRKIRLKESSGVFSYAVFSLDSWFLATTSRDGQIRLYTRQGR